MDTFRSRRIYASYKVLVHILCHKRNHRSCSLGDCHKSCVQGHVCIDLILLHSLCPETLTASSYIPVTHFVHKFLKCSCTLRNFVGSKVFVNSFYHRIQLAEKPFVHNRKAVIVQIVFCRVKLVNICIKHKERISVPQSAHEFTLSFHNSFAVETVRQPRSAVDIEIPADSVCAVFFQSVKRIYRISFGLTHLLSVFILNMSQNNNISVRSLFKQQGRLCQKRIEPSSCLVDCLGNKICRELLLKQILIFKWIMMLRKRHCS
ncbi:unknown [Blautia sp. CAG:257]|nr:unknown [Blautia sp. CAG:257]